MCSYTDLVTTVMLQGAVKCGRRGTADRGLFLDPVSGWSNHISCPEGGECCFMCSEYKLISVRAQAACMRRPCTLDAVLLQNQTHHGLCTALEYLLCISLLHTATCRVVAFHGCCHFKMARRPLDGQMQLHICRCQCCWSRPSSSARRSSAHRRAMTPASKAASGSSSSCRS